MEGIWEALRERLDYAGFVPQLVPDMERAVLRRRDGSPYTVVKNPRGDKGAGTYLELQPADVELLDLMDGQRDVQAILIDHLQEKGVLALDRLARLTAALGAAGFFGEERPPLYEKLKARRARRDPVVRLSLLLRKLIIWDIARWENADRFADLAYRAGGRLAFTGIGGALVVLLCVVGLVVWWWEASVPQYDLLRTNGSYVLGIFTLVVLQVLSISLHEAGHALAIRHYGRRVRRLGLAIYYLFPCVYVDSTDMALAPRRQRIIVALAGPLGGLAIGAVCALVAATSHGTFTGDIAYKAANLFVFQFVLNLLPILELDGYHIMVDALEAPFLRQRAIGFVRGTAMRKLRRREKWTANEVGLALYGGSAILISIGMLFLALLLWRGRIGAAATELIAVGPVGILGLGVVGLVFIGPLIVALVARLVGWGRMVARTAASRRRAAVEAVLLERARLLSRVRFLNGLPRQALMAIAEHLQVERFAAEEMVVTAGEPGDRFYLVRSGRLEAIAPDGTSFGVMVPGEGFGELALLDRTTRTATVKTLEPAELWSLDRGSFHRWVSERLEVAARIRADRTERDRLAALPFFKGLSGQELDRIARRLVVRRYTSGDAVVRAGDRPDGYYVIREGTADVTAPDGSPIRTLGPGDGFGELALLFGGPRTATVTARTDLVCGVLARADFANLVRGSGETVGEFRARTSHYVGSGLGGTITAGG